MLTRAISGAVFVSLLVFSILFSPILFLGLFYLLMIISIFEFSRMLHLKNSGVYIIATLLYISSQLPIWDVTPMYTDILAVVGILSLFITSLFSKKSTPIKELGNLFLCLAYTCIPYIFISRIPYTNFNNSYEGILILGVFIMIWSNDTFAYLTGMSIGKNKLLERISPKKTIEGFIGGVLATLIVSYLIALQFDVLSTLQWMIIGILVSFFGVLGDLIASMFKRQTGVKDTGNIIPGHGGILDRLDSIIFAAPFIYLYLKFITEHVS
jgi:phosphatidate cytidylyltransferase